MGARNSNFTAKLCFSVSNFALLDENFPSRRRFSDNFSTAKSLGLRLPRHHTAANNQHLSNTATTATVTTAKPATPTQLHAVCQNLE